MSVAVQEGATERDSLLPVDSSPQEEAPYPGNDDPGQSGEPRVFHRDGVLPKLGASMFDFFTTGCAMAAVGVLLPDIERHYQTSDGITAFVFPAGMIGYVCATASVEPICLRFGQRGVAIVSPVMRLIAALLLATGPPFGVLLAAYVCFGYGTGLTDTAWNTWASGLHRPNVLQGLLHGSFSLGCVLGPITAVAVLRDYPWSHFYLVMALLSVVELIAQGWAFRHESAESLQRSSLATEPNIDGAKPSSLLRQPAIWICGALGRYALGLVTERYGITMSVAAYISLAIFFQILLNLVSDVKMTMMLLAANGFFVAPLFPSGIVLLVSRLDYHLHMRAVALLIALGQVSGALAPLVVGFMADSLGIRHLFEVVCGLSAAMLVLWVIFTRTS